ncbi:hypothetical protein Hamer_G010162 [Homarus americanus]|uniref:Uncharacterized protein n=1 Tax=Homarus americanus TaxID=6706 RepID=A0A8J5KCV4_HOMAM|nr:hypothetical protein Hamer_G010162 [Homarus americanus]
MSKALSARLYDIDPSLIGPFKQKAIENVNIAIYIEQQREMRSKESTDHHHQLLQWRVLPSRTCGILQQEAEAADTSQQQRRRRSCGTSQQQGAVPAHTPQEDADLDSSYSSDWSGETQ